MSINAIYIDNNSFYVTGDRTSEFIVGRRLKIDCGADGVFYSTVISSIYSDPNTEVLVEDSVITSNIFGVLYGVVSSGAIGSLPDHSHNSNPGSGGEIIFVSSFLELTDTPSTYSGTENMYLQSTGSGIEFVELQTPASTFLDLTDTPVAYEAGKYLYSTSSGIVWANSTLVGTGINNKQWYSDLADAPEGTSYILDELSGEVNSVFISVAEGWLGSWANRIPITIDDSGVTSLVSYLPIKINIKVASGRTNIDLSYLFDEIGSNYQKIAIATASGVELYVEVSKWDVVNKEAVLWASSPDFIISSSGTTTLYLYYDNTFEDNTYVAYTGSSQATWDNGFTGVLHLAENANDAVGLHSGTSYGSMVFTGNHAIFDGVNDYITISTALTNFSISFWYNKNEDTLLGTAIISNNVSSNPYQGLFITDTGYQLDLDSGSTTLLSAASSFLRGDWHYITIVRSGSNAKLYEDTTLLIDGTISTSTFNFTQIGYRTTIGNRDEFLMKDLWISTIARSSDWIQLNILSQQDELITFGTSYPLVSQSAYLGTLKAAFTDLVDTPSTYSGIAGNYLRCTSSGIEAIDGIILAASDNSEWLLQVTSSGTLYTTLV